MDTHLQRTSNKVSTRSRVKWTEREMKRSKYVDNVHLFVINSYTNALPTFNRYFILFSWCIHISICLQVRCQQPPPPQAALPPPLCPLTCYTNCCKQKKMSNPHKYFICTTKRNIHRHSSSPPLDHSLPLLH